MALLSTVLCLVLAGSGVARSPLLNPFLDAAHHQESLSRLESCFCQLQGRVEECCCDVETVDRLNQDRIFPVLSKLLTRPFFNFYQVNLNKRCPFWPDSSKCFMRSCHVEACTEANTPAYLWEGEDGSPAPTDQGAEEEVSEEQCVSEGSDKLSDVDTRISEAQREEFEDWRHHDDSEDNFCDPEDSSQGELSYVDLSINPERFTGYAGHSAHRVWEAIYKENCFRCVCSLCIYKRAVK